MNERVKLIRQAARDDARTTGTAPWYRKSRPLDDRDRKAGLDPKPEHSGSGIELNPEWLETGVGEMFNAEPDLTAYMHRTDNSLPLQSVPSTHRRNGRACAPLHRTGQQQKPVNFIHIPNLPKCDGAIYIVGDSMYPCSKAATSSSTNNSKTSTTSSGGHVPPLDRHRRRRVHHREVYSEIGTPRMREARQPEPAPRRQGGRNLPDPRPSHSSRPVSA